MISDTSTGGNALPAGSSNLLVAAGFRGTWVELPRIDLPPVAAVLTDGHLDALSAVLEHVRSARELLVVAAARVDEVHGEELRRDGFAIVRGDRVEAPTAERPADPGRLWLLTSGSTGRPKRVAHSLRSLTTVASDQPGRRWLCPYTPGTYAWWQLVTLSLAHPGQEIVFADSDQRDSWPDLARAESVTAVSGTPTFWRHALWHAGDTVAQLPLEQVTLGGEPVDQAILDRLTQIFPQARVSWIYASSEAGATIAVHDGRAGFPVSWLERTQPGRPRLSIEDNELLIRSPYSADGLVGVLRTGDHVDVVDDRVLITSRVGSDEINVGGSKASASEVRRVLLAHPEVVWAHVTARRAPIVGAVVAAELVVAGTLGEQELTRWCAERLPDYAVPRRLRFLDDIPIKETLKSDV